MRRSRGGQNQIARRVIGLLPLTAVIILFGAIVGIIGIFSTTRFSDCEFAAFWASGWFEFSSLFQWIAVAIAASIVLWLASLIDRDGGKAWGETLAQGALLFALAFWLLAIKSYLFPYATPAHARMIAIVDAAFPRTVVFDEEFDPRARDGNPDRPQVEFEDHPMFNPAINKRLPEIFTSRFSPTAADYKRMQACVAEQKRALAQYEKDRETLKVYWRRVDLAASPKRPRDWRDELAEELARESAERSVVSDE
jgi:hypothetical protein